MAQALSTTFRELMERIMETHDEIDGRKFLDLPVKHVDLYHGQDLGPEGGISTAKLPFNLRAVLIEFAPIAWRSIGRHKQRAEGVRINLHILSECKLETSSMTPPFQRNLALEHLDFLDDITYRLMGWSGSYTTSLSRVEMVPYESKGIVHKHILTFECAMEDDAAMRSVTSLSPVLNPTITLPTPP